LLAGFVGSYQAASAAAKWAIWSACVFTKLGRAVAGDVAATGRIFRQPVEAVNQAQNVRHKDVGD